MGLFSFVGNLIGAGKQKKASRKAQASLEAALNRGIDEQTRQFDLTRADYEPARNLLAPSVTGLADLIGVNGGDAQSTGLDAIRNSPLLAQLMKSSEEAILQNASATGGLRGGDVQGALYDNAGAQFNQQLEAQLARLAGLTGIGMGATDSVSAFGANKANNITDLLGKIGGAQASGLLQRGGITAQMFNNAGSFLDKAASSFMPTSGFGATLGKLF